MSIRAFRANTAGTSQINVSASSQAVAIVGSVSACDVLVTNEGTATVWIEFGASTVAAVAATGTPVLAGVTQVLRASNADSSPLYAAAIAAGATGKIYFTRGDGF